MAQEIWKYEAPLTERLTFELKIPKGARILKLALQYGKPTLWVLVDGSADEEVRRFRFILTGCSLPTDGGKYIDTLFLENDGFVVHLFETTNTS
jgi:hypothetical protein